MSIKSEPNSGTTVTVRLPERNGPGERLEFEARSGANR